MKYTSILSLDSYSMRRELCGKFQSCKNFHIHSTIKEKKTKLKFKILKISHTFFTDILKCLKVLNPKNP